MLIETTVRCSGRLTMGLVLILQLLCYTVDVAADELALEFIEVAPGIHVHLGKHEEMSVSNDGDIANIGFIVGTEAVAVIDPGGSPVVGRAMRESISNLSDLPVTT